MGAEEQFAIRRKPEAMTVAAGFTGQPPAPDRRVE